jgi:enoyl-CoA hydratase/carnithine racemase
MIAIGQCAGVTTLTLNRPERRNALDAAMIRDLCAALASAATDTDCRCVVLKGAGGNFCSGRDLGAASELRGLAPVLEYDDAYTRIFLLLANLEKPSVAVVQGYAVAGGFTLAMGCDFVLAETGAQFGALEMKHGFPAALNSAVLAHKTQPRNALELLLSAGMHGAQRLYEMGLVNRVAADAGELVRIEAEFVAALVALDPLAVKLTKETLRAAASMPYAEALTLGKQLNALLMASGRIAEAQQPASAVKPK